MYTNELRTSVLLMPLETVNLLEEQIMIALMNSNYVCENNKTALALELLDALYKTQITGFEIPIEQLITESQNPCSGAKKKGE